MADLDFAFVDTANLRERVMHDLLIMIDGVQFDVEDLRELLDAVEDGGVVVSNDATGQMLLRLDVLENLGSQKWMARATEGPNFEAFSRTLDDLLKKHHPGYN